MFEEPLPAVSLSGMSPLDKGRFRQVFIHPADDSKCIKIDHYEKPEKGTSLLALFRTPLSGNDREAGEYRRLTAKGVDYQRYFPRLYGMVDTDLGKGLCVELLRGTDGKVPVKIKDHLREKMPPPREFCEFFRDEYQKFAAFCERHLINSVSNGFENLGIIHVYGAPKLVSFDLKAVSSKHLIPLTKLSSAFAKQRIRRRFDRHIQRFEWLAAGSQLPQGVRA